MMIYFVACVMRESERLCGFTAFAFFFGAGEEGDEGGGVDHAVVIDFHGVEGVVDFLGCELVTPGHQRVTEAVIND